MAGIPDKILICKRHSQELFHVSVREGLLEIICKECEIERNEGRHENGEVHVFFTKSGEALCDCISKGIERMGSG